MSKSFSIKVKGLTGTDTRLVVEDSISRPGGLYIEVGEPGRVGGAGLHISHAQARRLIAELDRLVAPLKPEFIEL